MKMEKNDVEEELVTKGETLKLWGKTSKAKIWEQGMCRGEVEGTESQ